MMMRESRTLIRLEPPGLVEEDEALCKSDWGVNKYQIQQQKDMNLK